MIAADRDPRQARHYIAALTRLGQVMMVSPIVVVEARQPRLLTNARARLTGIHGYQRAGHCILNEPWTTDRRGTKRRIVTVCWRPENPKGGRG